jgi:hypothetical protein
VRKRGNGDSYEGKTDEQISICCYYLEGCLEALLKKHFSSDVQFGNYNYIGSYDEYGWNFYTPEQIFCILTELEKYIESQDKSDIIICFYSRFIIRMKQMLNNMDGYDSILFCGP